MRLSAWVCVLIWLPVCILCSCATAPINSKNEIEKARQEFDDTSTIVANVDFIPQKALYYDKLKTIYIELSDLQIKSKSTDAKRVRAECERIKKRCRDINAQVQKDVIKIFEQKIERMQKKPGKSNQRRVQYLNDTLKILNKPELNPDELQHIVVTWTKAEERKTDVLMNVSFGAGNYQLTAKGKKHLKSLFSNNIERVNAQIAKENIDIPLLLNFSFEISGYTDEVGFSSKSAKKLGKQCNISFKSNQQKNRKELNRCLSKLRAAEVGEYFHTLKLKDSHANSSDKIVKTDFIIKTVGKGEEMPDDLKDGRPRDERRRMCKIIFTYWKEVQTQ